MKSISVRRFGALAMGGLVAAVLPVVATPAANAITDNLTYTCALPLGNSSPITVKLDTTAPTAVKPNTSFTPLLQMTIAFPEGFIQGLRGNGFNTLSASAGKATITTDNVQTPAQGLTFPPKTLPTSGGITVATEAVALAKQTPTAEGSIVYRTGPLAFTLRANNTAISATCTKAGEPAVIDTVTVDEEAVTPPPPAVKASSRIGTGVIYVKKTRKLTVAGRVITTPAKRATGKVNFSVFTKGKKIRNVTVNLNNSQNLAKRTLAGKFYKGTYRLVITYSGSASVKASKATRIITIRK